MKGMLQDLRYAVRTMGRARGFTAVAVLTLALGIGANASIFSLVNGMLLRPLPYPDADRLVQIWETNRPQQWDQASLSWVNFMDWKAASRSFEGMALYRGRDLNLTGGGQPERLEGVAVTADLFTILRVHPALGRDFRPEEDRPGAGRVALLSHGLWARRFGRAPDMIGRNIVLDGVPHTVVGIMPEDFTFFFRPVDLWVPLAMDAAREERGHHGYRGFGRLDRNVTLEQARADLQAIAARLESEFPDTNAGWGAALVPLNEEIFDSTLRTVLKVFMLAVAFVLLIACANVAGLLLARAASREKEIAVRLALGAGRGRLVRQLLVESSLLGLLGGAGGVLTALWGISALHAVAPPEAPGMANVRLDGTVLLYTLGLSLATGLVFGLAPALQATRGHPHLALKEGGRTSSTQGRHRLLKGLVVGEVALACTLLACGGLMIRTVTRLQAVDTGLQRDRVLTLRLALPATRYGRPPQRVDFYRRALERIRGLPDVEDASIVSSLPLNGSEDSSNITIEGRPPAAPGEDIIVRTMVIGTDYFSAFGIPLRSGRDFTDRDDAGAPPVLIINETMARRHFPGGESPIGKRLVIGSGGSGREFATIVGVVADVLQQNLTDPPRAETYWPHAQVNGAEMTLVVRTTTEPLRAVPAVRQAIWSIDPNQPIAEVFTMAAVIDQRMTAQRAIARVLGVLSGVALLLAAIGLYGLVAWSVSRRTAEIGVRMALGAQPRDVLKLVLRQGAVLLASGMLLGLLGALAMTRMLASLLFGVGTADPLTYAASCLVLGATALAACWIPARRAAGVDPNTALRCE